MRKTKIVATLGPATDNPDILRGMISAGMNVARINMSHGDYVTHAERIAAIKKIRNELNKPVALLLDTKGPEIRIKTIENGAIILVAGQTFTLTTEELIGTQEIVSITYPNLPNEVAPGDTIYIDDGFIELRVKTTTPTQITCTVVNGGHLSSRKSLNLPGITIKMPFMSDVDKQDLLFGISQDVDYVAASFSRNADDIRQIRTFLRENGGTGIHIIAKIENQDGVKNIDDIIAVSDGIMVARGDMGIEIPFEQLPAIQKNIIKKGHLAGRYVITATQMLESMIQNPRPNRAETSDIANAVYDGTSALMLSGETAIGKYPVECVQTMASIARQTEQNINYKKRFRQLEVDTSGVADAISHATCTTAHDILAKAIIVVTQSGSTARMVSRFRPAVPIIAATPSKKVYYQLAISWAVYPVMAETQHNSDTLFAHAIDCARILKYVHEGDLVVITAGVPLGVTGTTNILKVETVQA